MSPTPHPFGWTLAGAATLVAVLAVATGVALAAEDWHPDRLRAIGFAAATCLVGGLGGWLAGRSGGPEPARAVAAGLAAVAVRIFPPLAALAWLQSAAGARLREQHAGGWLLVFYLALLATDILLHIIGSRGAKAEN